MVLKHFSQNSASPPRSYIRGKLGVEEFAVIYPPNGVIPFHGFAMYGKHKQLIHRGSYMSAHVLLNLLNEFGKRDKMRGLSSILSLFRNEFNKFNITRPQMLDSVYHMTLRLL